MLIVHHLNVSQSERIVWLLEELDLPFELCVYQRDLARYGQGRLTVPVTSAHYPDYLYWFHYANGSLMTQISLNGCVAKSY